MLLNLHGVPLGDLKSLSPSLEEVRVILRQDRMICRRTKSKSKNISKDEHKDAKCNVNPNSKTNNKDVSTRKQTKISPRTFTQIRNLFLREVQEGKELKS